MVFAKGDSIQIRVLAGHFQSHPLLKHSKKCYLTIQQAGTQSDHRTQKKSVLQVKSSLGEFNSGLNLSELMHHDHQEEQLCHHQTTTSINTPVDQDDMALDEISPDVVGVSSSTVEVHTSVGAGADKMDECIFKWDQEGKFMVVCYPS